MAAAIADVKAGMRVLDAGGAEQGVVDSVEGDRIKVPARGVSGGGERWLPFSAVERVDDAVHIDRTASGAGGGFGLPPLRNAAVAGSRPRRNYYLPWVIGAVVLALAIAIVLSLRHRDQTEAMATGVALPSGRTVKIAPGSLNDDVQRFLASTEPAPRTFSFDTLAFDDGKVAIPSRAEPGLNSLAQILVAYPQAFVQVVGYGDPRKDARDRPDPTLGQRRAAAIAGALVARGVPTDAIDPISGDDPAYVAGTPPPAADAGNRHADLVVVRK